MSVLEFDCRFAYRSGFSLDMSFCAEAVVTALVGPSGSGKTTVLNLIAGLLRPDVGRITLQNEPLFDSEKKIDVVPEKRGIGYVFQDFMLFPHLSVAENLRYGYSRQRSRGIEVGRAVAMLELEGLLDRSPISLSGGEKQRVALGRALLRNPRLLLLDEPLNALDMGLRTNVLKYLERIVAEFNIPTLLVSHDSTNIAALAAGIVMMPNENTTAATI
jgi:molybdate transport system ATP-binding protein